MFHTEIMEQTSKLLKLPPSRSYFLLVNKIFNIQIPTVFSTENKIGIQVLLHILDNKNQIIDEIASRRVLVKTQFLPEVFFDFQSTFSLKPNCYLVLELVCFEKAGSKTRKLSLATRVIPTTCEGSVNAKKQGEYYAPIMDIGMIKANCG